MPGFGVAFYVPPVLVQWFTMATRGTSGETHVQTVSKVNMGIFHVRTHHTHRLQVSCVKTKVFGSWSSSTLQQIHFKDLKQLFSSPLNLPLDLPPFPPKQTTKKPWHEAVNPQKPLVKLPHINAPSRWRCQVSACELKMVIQSLEIWCVITGKNNHMSIQSITSKSEKKLQQQPPTTDMQHG